MVYGAIVGTIARSSSLIASLPACTDSALSFYKIDVNEKAMAIGSFLTVNFLER